MTRAEAGLPGREKMSFVSRWGCACPCEDEDEDEDEDDGLKGIVANVVGFPGFMETRPKWMVPPRERSMVGLRRSSSPIDTPPVVIIMSTLDEELTFPMPRRPSRRVCSSSPGVSRAIPRSTVGNPQDARQDRREGRLESRIWPPWRVTGPLCSTSSSPVLSTPMQGFLYTLTVLVPVAASRPISPPTDVIRSPFCRTRDPSAISLPGSRTFSPGLISPVRISTVASSVPSGVDDARTVSSTMATALAFGGRGAPVVILAMVPGSRGVRVPPGLACVMEATGKVPFVLGPVVGDSGAMTAYPSTMLAR